MAAGPVAPPRRSRQAGTPDTATSAAAATCHHDAMTRKLQAAAVGWPRLTMAGRLGRRLPATHLVLHRAHFPKKAVRLQPTRHSQTNLVLDKAHGVVDGGALGLKANRLAVGAGGACTQAAGEQQRAVSQACLAGCAVREAARLEKKRHVARWSHMQQLSKLNCKKSA